MLLVLSALETIAYLRNLPESHPYVQGELAGIVEQVEMERAARSGTGSVVRETFGKGNRRRLFTGVMISE